MAQTTEGQHHHEGRRKCIGYSGRSPAKLCLRAADDPRTSSANPPRAPDLNRKATDHGVAEIWQDARVSLVYSVRTSYTKSGITYLERTTTLPDDARVRGSHSVTIDEPGRNGSRSIRRLSDLQPVGTGTEGV